MKKMILASLLMLVSSSVFADGIPVPMDQQTKYNWTCSKGDRLHLTLDQIGPTIWIADGGTTGTPVPQEVADALISKNIQKLDGQSFTYTKHYVRTVSFEVNGKLLNVKMKSPKEDYVNSATNCRAQF